MVTPGQLRSWALELPDVEERETWGNATFRVREKIFVILRDEDDDPTASVKADRQEQAELIDGDPASYGIASHVGRFGWVSVRLRTVDPGELHSVVLGAWFRTCPARRRGGLSDELRALLPTTGDGRG
ncbi:MmcQ/YjbR family DNA-binding protein [Kineococcus rubinsiae]|uniref:MmcQ/YjbR family DNA-binding protein n=1 Tax=Kineococcus rubinsiae TaxID=2609562 RepID=UPI001430318E|nr:MmcQ/YjbR family DNA-binding protein [Kineococcus rubinsiae]NIZ93290.1 MmcQ/YjbR family DNA-binding protein [Kineococcus rubinsiae]